MPLKTARFLTMRLYRFTRDGLYYLQSRYYDPEVGRFINADGYAITGKDLLAIICLPTVIIIP